MLYAIVAVIALIIDQAVKYWTTVNIVVDTGEAKLIPGLVHLANVHNTGAAFSFLEGARWFFVILCIIFCAVVIYLLVKNIISQPIARWAAVLVMAGAIGNCIDRIVCGYVVDMFEFDFLIFGKPFPVFNVADIYITVGVIIFCICILTEKPKAAKKKTNVPLAEAAARQAESKVEAEAEAQPQQRKPLISRRKRTPIPDFPKREHVAEPQVNPDDPFAEWEKRGSTVYSQPDKNYSPEAVDFVNRLAAEEPVAQPTPAAPAAGFEPAPVADFESAPQRAETPPAPAPAAAPAAPAAPTVTYPAPAAKEQTEADSFNLDDILAEFKDL